MARDTGTNPGRAASDDIDVTQKEVGDKSDSKTKKQKEQARILSEALTVVRTAARAEDYFSGYTLTEVIQERLDQIGEDVEEARPPDAVAAEFRKNMRTSAARLKAGFAGMTGRTRMEELALLRSNTLRVVAELSVAPDPAKVAKP